MKSASRRREGFSGETLLVVPAPLCAMMESHPLLAGLHVTHAGFFPRAPGHLVHRPQGTPEHVLIVCLRGNGWAETGARRVNLERGDVISLPAGEAHSYGAAAERPWSIAWVHFRGDEALEWLQLATGRRGAGVCHTPADRLDSLGIDRVHAVLEAGFGLPELIDAANALRACLLNLSRRRVQNSAGLSAQERVNASVAHLRTHWTQPYRVAELAAAAGLSVTHYTAIFRHLTGFSPIDFVLRTRTQHAAHQLLTTLTPVAEIALGCGFNDPYYFTRCFTRIMGTSPRAHRTAQTSRAARDALPIGKVILRSSPPTLRKSIKTPLSTHD